MFALALDVALGALVATDAGAAEGVVWFGTALSVIVLAAGLVLASSSAVQWSAALAGVLLLLRHDQRLILAPLYGACLLLLSELSQRSLELRWVERVAAGVTAPRVVSCVLVAALGACAAAIVATAVTIAPDRSVLLTAAGAIGAVTVFAAIARLGRRYRQQAASEPGRSE